MNAYEEKLKKYISDNAITAEHMVFEESCHSVKEAAAAVGASEEDLVKNICLVDKNGNLIVAIVKGEDRVNTSKVKQAAEADSPRIATLAEILEKTGYPCGGVPSFGYNAKFLVDEKVQDKQLIYTGGGSENALVRITPGELLKANGGKIADIRK